MTCAALAPLLCGGLEAQERRAETVRDRWGVPHIFAGTETDG